MMKVRIDPERKLFSRSPMIFGQFLEHFHRQIYGGIFMPGHPLSDEDGFRMDVLEALKRICVPVIRWPGGCFVSAYHWENGVGKNRIPSFDKAWRVEDDNSFGTDEFIQFCKKLGCEPYICTNAGSGTSEEMSNWVEYCNLSEQGQFARRRISNGHVDPYRVRYWSIGNENYYDGEIGSKTVQEWGRFVRESAKMMKRVDPEIQLSAASIADVEWNVRLLQEAGERMNLISIHGYWDELWQEDSPASYSACMARTKDLDRDVRRIRGLLNAFGLEKQIKIAYDEWNLRGWHHPAVDHAPLNDSSFIEARDRNDMNSTYTMADAVFSACFLNMLLRNADIVNMANFAPVVNTRGAIYTYDKGIVLRPTYYVFELYTRFLGEEILDCYTTEAPEMERKDRFGNVQVIPQADVIATKNPGTDRIAVAMVNKHESEILPVDISVPYYEERKASLMVLAGTEPDAYNDIGRNMVVPEERSYLIEKREDNSLRIQLPPHSVSVMTL